MKKNTKYIELSPVEEIIARRQEEQENVNVDSLNYSKLGLLKAAIFNNWAEAASILNVLWLNSVIDKGGYWEMMEKFSEKGLKVAQKARDLDKRADELMGKQKEKVNFKKLDSIKNIKQALLGFINRGQWAEASYMACRAWYNTALKACATETK